MGWDKSSNTTANVLASGDRFSRINSGEISCPRPVYLMGNLPPSLSPTHLKFNISVFIVSIFLVFRLFSLFYTPQRVRSGGGAQVLVVHMGVNLGGVQVIVTQYLLEGAHIHAVLQHQGSGGVAQLVGGVLGAVQSGGGQVLLHQLVDRRCGDAPPVLEGDKQGILIYQGHGVPLGEPVRQRPLTGVVQEQHPFLVALAQHPQLIAPNICFIQAHQLGNTQAAIEKQRQDTVITGRIFAVHTVQKLQTFVQIQVFGQRFLQPRRVQVLNRVGIQQLGLIGQILIERPDGSDLAGPGGVVQAAVPRQVVHVGIDVCERDISYQSQIGIVDGNIVQ